MDDAEFKYPASSSAVGFLLGNARCTSIFAKRCVVSAQ